MHGSCVEQQQLEQQPHAPMHEKYDDTLLVWVTCGMWAHLNPAFSFSYPAVNEHFSCCALAPTPPHTPATLPGCLPAPVTTRSHSYFLRDGVKPPLGIGDVLLEDGSEVKGFIGETYAVKGAPDITKYGGWRAYLASQSPSKGKGKGGSDGRSSGAASPVPNGTAAPAPQAAAGSSIGGNKSTPQAAAVMAGVALFMCAVMA
jgi:hypothetical protein